MRGITRLASHACLFYWVGFSAAGCPWTTAVFSTDKVVELAPPIIAVDASGDSQWQGEIRVTSPQALEIEWFTFAGKLYRRERTGLESQHLSRADLNDESIVRTFLLPDEVEAHFRKLGLACDKATVIPPNDPYAVIPIVPGSPIYRIVCGNAWFHIDGANGAMLQRLDSSRRAYRWLYSALHTLDVPALLARPQLRTLLIVTLSSCGLLFSLTALVIGWRRLKTAVHSPAVSIAAFCG
jgi:hypothetical protein